MKRHYESEKEDSWDREQRRLQWLTELKKAGELPIELELELETLIKRDPMYLGNLGGVLKQKTKPWLK
jgi:hypothetical protein